jgi:hypothetical protein
MKSFLLTITFLFAVIGFSRPVHATDIAAPPPALALCSKLDFTGLDWSSSVSVGDRTAYALALNISGTFEGNDGWQNLTNNFDGQGWSYGLLNQCLGQGSLQPMLLQMRDHYLDEMKGVLAAANLNSLLGMLNKWQSHASALAVDDLASYGLSPLDDPEAIKEITGFEPAEQFLATLRAENQESVNWAVATLYSGSNFKAVWKNPLLALAETQGYRSIQAETGVAIHKKTMTLFKHFKLTEVRSYVFLFDIVVQNGGIAAPTQKTIDALLARSPNLSETQKLNTILAERLLLVNKKYVADVRSRKASIINGTGVVHGERRNYEKEYCADMNLPLP